MRMYSYDQVLADVKDVYEQLTGLPAPEIDIKKPRFPLPKGINPVGLVQSEINQLNMCLINSGVSWRLAKSPAWAPPTKPRTLMWSIWNCRGWVRRTSKLHRPITYSQSAARGISRKRMMRSSITAQSEATERSSDSFRCQAMFSRKG
jgi:hypothetical protein